MFSGEAANTNCIVFGLTRSGLEPTIYPTRGEHANQYATDAAKLSFDHANYPATLILIIMCPSGATCLPTDFYFSELALLKSNSACWSSTKRISSTCHWKLTCSRHDITVYSIYRVVVITAVFYKIIWHCSFLQNNLTLLFSTRIFLPKSQIFHVQWVIVV
jgi:hypothetical protein